jgi:hypothetical protein
LIHVSHVLAVVNKQDQILVNVIFVVGVGEVSLNVLGRINVLVEAFVVVGNVLLVDALEVR